MNSYKKRALLIGLLLLVTGTLSVLYLTSQPTPSLGSIADIYQNGECIKSIPLTAVTDTYSFTVQGDNGAVNEIEVRPGSIGIIHANCPDKLCVHQGFISNSRLPITCLPNRLVIQIRFSTDADKITTDIISY